MPPTPPGTQTDSWCVVVGGQLTSLVQKQQEEISGLKAVAGQAGLGRAGSSAGQSVDNGRDGEWARIVGTWGEMVGEWKQMTRQAQDMARQATEAADAEAQREAAEHKRWRAGEALSGAVMEAAKAEDEREYAERARQSAEAKRAHAHASMAQNIALLRDEQVALRLCCACLSVLLHLASSWGARCPCLSLSVGALACLERS